MAKHNLKPTFVGRVLEHVPIREAHVLARAEQSEACPKNTYLAERCCSKDSEMMKDWYSQGGRGERVCRYGIEEMRLAQSLCQS